MSANNMFTHKFRVGFHHCDPAGIAYFGNSYSFAHEAFEDFVVHIGVSYKEWFQNPVWATPLRHTECDHIAPLLPSKTYGVQVSIESLSDSAINMIYTIVSDDGAKTHAVVKLTHVFIDKSTVKKTSIPADIRKRLETYQRESVAST